MDNLRENFRNWLTKQGLPGQYLYFINYNSVNSAYKRRTA